MMPAPTFAECRAATLAELERRRVAFRMRDFDVWFDGHWHFLLQQKSVFRLARAVERFREIVADAIADAECERSKQDERITRGRADGTMNPSGRRWDR